MDPASIVGLVAACSSLTKQCASVVKSLHGLIETYKFAELTILSVITECETVQFAWRRIESWAGENLHYVDDYEELRARLQKSVYCGELVMSALEEELLTITSNSSNLQRGLSVTWNNSVLIEHQHRIRGQVAALQLLLQVMNLPHKEDRVEVLSVKGKVFRDSDESALSIIPSDRSTRFSLDGNRLSMISEDGDIKYIRFSFEDALFTSHVYKRNYRFPTKQIEEETDLQSEPHTGDLIGSEIAGPETRTLTSDLNKGANEESSQDQKVQKHQDLLPGETFDTNNLFPEDLVESQLYVQKALGTANTAVRLDNAQNFEDAIERYRDTCKFISIAVALRSHAEDRRKLNTLMTIYKNRMELLSALVPMI